MDRSDPEDDKNSISDSDYGTCSTDNVRQNKKQICASNHEFVSVSCRKSIAIKTHNSNKATNPTPTRNRFSPLQQQEVSNDVSPDTLGDNHKVSQSVPPKKVGGNNPEFMNTVNSGINNTNGRKHKYYTKNQNPTGDIWDQKSLNLDTLFRLKVNEDIKIGVWNAESIRKKENLAKQYMLDNDLDVLLIVESWLEMNELPSTNEVLPCSEMYKLQQLPRPNRTNASGGGMLCVHKANLEIQKIPAIKTKVLEVMDLKIISKKCTIRLVSVYRPPRSKKRSYPIADFYEDMESLVGHYKTVTDEVIFCGDYNVHFNNAQESETKRFMNIIESANLIQHVVGRTHVKGNTLDLVMTERDSLILKHCEVDEFLSDHAAILIELNLRKPNKPKKKITFRENKNIDIKELESTIETNLSEIGDINDLDELVAKFNEALGDAYDKHAPWKSKTIIIRPPTPWTYDDIKKDKATRRKLERKWRRTGLQIDWEIYRDFRNEFNSKLNKFRMKQYADMIEQNKDDPTTLFRVINKSLHRNQASPLPTGLSNSELAEKFNNFFARSEKALMHKVT